MAVAGLLVPGDPQPAAAKLRLECRDQRRLPRLVDALNGDQIRG